MFGGSTCGQHVANICTQLSMRGDHESVGIIVWQLGAAVSHYWVVALVHLFVQNVVNSADFIVNSADFMHVNKCHNVVAIAQ